MTKRPARSKCTGQCGSCRRSTMNGGHCPTWGEVEALRYEVGKMRADYGIESRDMTARQIGVSFGIGKRAAQAELDRIAKRLTLAMGKAVGPQDGTPFRGSDLFVHPRSVWDGEEEAA